MDTSDTTKRQLILENFALISLYLLSARLSQFIAIPPGNITPIWIPSGIILMMALTRGSKIMPGIFLGAFLGNVWAYFSTESILLIFRSLTAGVLNGFGDTLCAFVGANLIRKTTKGEYPFDQIKDVISFIIWGALLPSAISAFIGVFGLTITEFISWSHFSKSFTTWWIGDGVGILVFCPFLLTWKQCYLLQKNQQSYPCRINSEEMLFFLTLPPMIYTLIYYFHPANFGWPAPLFIQTLLIWSALRLKKIITFSVIILMTISIIIITILGKGPFAYYLNVINDITHLQLFLIAIIIPTHLLQGASTENRTSQDLLIKLNSTLRSIIDGTLDAIYTKDLKGRYIIVNDAICRYINKKPHEIIGKDNSTIFNPYDAQRILELDNQIIVQKTIISTEEYVTLSNGKEAIFDSMKGPLFDTNGHVVGLFGVARNITCYKKIEEQLRENAERFYSYFNLPLIGICAISIDMKWLEVNDYLCILLGYSREELTKKTWAELTHPDDLASEIVQFNHVLKREIDDYTLEKRYICSDNRIIISEIAVRCVRKIDNSVDYFIACIQDITQKKINEQRLLNTERLESLGVLAGGIAHDFNNLLTGMFGFIDLARMSCQKKNCNQLTYYLSQALQMFNRAKDLSSQLLTFSKGGYPITKPGPIIPIIKRTIQFILSGSAIKINFDLNEDLFICNIDENQISQVLDNIIINAKQSMQDSRQTISVSAYNVTHSRDLPADLTPQDYICIKIEDTGSGIPPHILPHIFDPFFTTKKQGNGLGLSIAHSIIKKHKGTIEVKSKLEKGTIFYIYLPALPLNHYTFVETLKNEIDETDQFSQTPLLKRKALLMDDEKGIQMLYSEYLKILEYSVVSTKNGDEAIAEFFKALERDTPFDLVLLDLTIPGGLGGKEVITELRKAGIPFMAIASSGYTNDPIIANPQKFAFDDAISKPFLFDDLKKLLKKITPLQH